MKILLMAGLALAASAATAAQSDPRDLRMNRNLVRGDDKTYLGYLR